ncbi:MAG: bifunctional 5,10-methylenetetrahydrofolate dehydrogenase/5,10-methenyltetrahydrofolate cyclohydrolase [Bacteroidales bacterium]|nr:bifunctional 5,10-methylenetetrahydrofolate dehydrogenase/5,10-methenyltetrahydrofolate cyclohydrolase [Bacteroidales bacterium]
MQLLDGKKLAQEIKKEIAAEVNRLRQANQRLPKLALILVGNRSDSVSYVNSKEKNCHALGMECIKYHLPEETTQEALLQILQQLNDDSNVDGILVQLPLPAHIDTGRVLENIDYQKDADGLHHVNLGLMLMGDPYVLPCTPNGILHILKRYNIPMDGQKAVVVGRSILVGAPTAILLQQHHATVTQCHSHTRNLAEICRDADIVVTAAGVPGLLRPEDLKDGAVLVDVAMNHDDNGLCGDIYSKSTAPVLEQRLAAATPVPGGVGPMTIAMLMYNVLQLYKKHETSK